MVSRIDTILLCVKFGDDSISSLDFSFIGGVPLILKVEFAKKLNEFEFKVSWLVAKIMLKKVVTKYAISLPGLGRFSCIHFSIFY